MKAIPTKTINPLPFNDLEPHRFEDLIRQLAYEFRRWKSLEAIGRSGSDDGIDIRAIEIIPLHEEQSDEGSDTETRFSERLWIFQCKREKSLSAQKLRKVVAESLRSLTSPPHGFVLAVACDISKKTRDAFRVEMIARGIEEFFIWARSELEDMLFQSQNDRLLFAYFGITLQPRRRNLATILRSEVTKKKQLATLIGDDERDGKLVLLRDPTDQRYPYRPETSEAPTRWTLCKAFTWKKPGLLMVLHREYLAAISADRTQWDAILDNDIFSRNAKSELRSHHAWSEDEDIDDHNDRRHYDFWNEYIEESHRAYLKHIRAIPLERILALDPLGDGFFPIPHILVEFADMTGPFTSTIYTILDGVHSTGGRIDIDLSDENRTRIFPIPLPAETDPVPEDFDDTSKEVSALSIASDERLQTLLTKTTEKKQENNANTPNYENESRQKLLEFQQWRENIALPLFSCFVEQLRSTGHWARISVRSTPYLPSEREGFESVELRVRFHKSSTYNPSYFMPGRILISTSSHSMAWHTAISPSASEGSGRSGGWAADKGVKITAVTTKEQLEDSVLAMLERLSIDQY